MRIPRISLAGLMIAILFIAAGLSALKSGSAGWAAVSAAGFMAVLLAGTVFLFVRSPKERAGWLAFSAIGWSYWTIAVAYDCDPAHALLPTTWLIDRAYDSIHPQQRRTVCLMFDGVYAGNVRTYCERNTTPGGSQPPPQAIFRVIGHSQAGLLVAILGGGLGRLLSGRRSAGRPGAMLTSS